MLKYNLIPELLGYISDAKISQTKAGIRVDTGSVYRNHYRP